VEDSRELLGINNREELAEADRVFRERKARELMRAGVTIEKPETVTIDSLVKIGPDTVVEAHAQILGATVIGEDCHVGAGSIVRNATLGDGSAIQPFTLVEDCEIGRGVSVGPYARLRMHAVLEDKSRVGNFVELKNAKLGAGAKANHLAYIGDAEVGAKSNIGAGTITCNYDGVNKHRTVIGAGAFVGSNSTLVAPVEVGDGAYVAAGSTITKPVPADALGLGRSRQENKEGWARSRREKQARQK
jgi:bifunctional UDP-N-acetylglucosamine pyrophosphorylase/glucosamine-1-phosphate N-acetyltransferase